MYQDSIGEKVVSCGPLKGMQACSYQEKRNIKVCRGRWTMKGKTFYRPMPRRVIWENYHGIYGLYSEGKKPCISIREYRRRKNEENDTKRIT